MVIERWHKVCSCLHPQGRGQGDKLLLTTIGPDTGLYWLLKLETAIDASDPVQAKLHYRVLSSLKKSSIGA